MLELINIKKDYPAGSETVHALKGIDLKFRESEFVSILGPSGCGKTTMLNIIGGLDKYTEGRKVIFVTGGSQGAKKFNDVVINLALEKKSNKFFVVLCTGMKNYEGIYNRLKNVKDAEKYIKLERFVFDMDKMYKISDLLITRAGAMTITELTLVSKPAILVPFPYAAENHQYYNAKVLEDAGAGKIIIENDFKEETLYREIEQIINSEDKLKIMSDCSKSIQKNDVEQVIYNEIVNVIKR